MVWFGAGAAVIILTHLLRAWGESPLARFGPLIPMCLGAFGLVYGVERMVGGLRVGLANPDLSGRVRARRALVACILLLVLAVSAGAAAWAARAPYWNAIKERNRGDAATEKLRALAERHAAAMQSGASGAAALNSWKETTAAGLQLRPDFAGALEGSRYLENNATGRLRDQASIDTRFYTLCMDWMGLYQEIQRSLGETSMLEPPDDWAERQNAIIEKIQALPRHPPEAS